MPDLKRVKTFPKFFRYLIQRVSCKQTPPFTASFLWSFFPLYNSASSWKYFSLSLDLNPTPIGAMWLARSPNLLSSEGHHSLRAASPISSCQDLSHLVNSTPAALYSTPYSMSWSNNGFCSSSVTMVFGKSNFFCRNWNRNNTSVITTNLVHKQLTKEWSILYGAKLLAKYLTV